MKKLRIPALLLGAAMALTLVSGCSKETAPTLESVITSAQERSNAAASQDMDMVLDCNMEASQMGITVDASILMDCDIQETQDPEVAHILGDMKVSSLGSEQAYTLDSYAAKDGDSYVSYSNIIMGEEESGWVKASLDVSSLQGYSGVNNYDFITVSPEEYTFTENEDGTCTVTGAVSGEQFNELFSENSEISTMMSDMGIEMGSMAYTMDMLFSPVSGQKGAYELTSCSVALTEPFVITQDGVEITFSKMDITIVVNGYNTVDTIEIPEEALQAEEISY
ncbi:MAG: hypothetical protein K5637_07210 [Lachnospiraceae bacterium]|nr:hypothetical protein [Lachnospiraceae bacterium]